MTQGPTADVTVLGAGIVGACCALSLIEAGLSVEIVDRDPPGEGASHGNAGVISPWSCVPQSVPGLWRQVPGMLLSPDGPVRMRPSGLPGMTSWALKFFAQARPARMQANADAMAFLIRDAIDTYRRQLKGTGGDGLLIDSWYVNVFRGAPPDMDGPAYALRRAHGAPVKLVDAPTLREIEPAVSPDCAGAVVIRGQARAASPGALTKALVEEALRRGARFVRTEVRGLDAEARTLATKAGPRPFAKLVLAGGFGSAALLKAVGYDVAMRAERGYHVEFDGPEVTLTHSVMDIDGKFVASSMGDSLRSAGTSEFAAPDAPPDRKRTDLLVRQTRRLLPGLAAAPARTWMGVRPSFPDSLPAIGPIEGLPGVTAAFGHSHYGMSMAPGTGGLVAQIVAGRALNEDVSAFDPARWMSGRRRAA